MHVCMYIHSFMYNETTHRRLPSQSDRPLDIEDLSVQTQQRIQTVRRKA